MSVAHCHTCPRSTLAAHSPLHHNTRWVFLCSTIQHILFRTAHAPHTLLHILSFSSLPFLLRPPPSQSPWLLHCSSSLSSSPSSASPPPSPSPPRFRHTNFHTELERQYQLGLRTRPPTSGNVQTLTITQPLDHFDRLNNATYEQTYWVNEQYWNGTSDSPVFLYLGGEWEESGSTLEYGANVMSVWAKTFGGLMVDIQHRYYNGVPAVRDGNPAGIEYLSSEQAIADVAAVVTHLNNFYAANRSVTGLKWIHMGGSYAGNMAAYYRLKYPHLSVGAFAISGPVEAVVDYTGFFAVEGHDLTPACLNTTRAAVRALDALVADPQKGWPQISADFNVNFTDPVLDPAVWGFELTWGLLGGGAICRYRGGCDAVLMNLVKLRGAARQLQHARIDPEDVWTGNTRFLWYYQTCTSDNHSAYHFTASHRVCADACSTRSRHVRLTFACLVCTA